MMPVRPILALVASLLLSAWTHGVAVPTAFALTDIPDKSLVQRDAGGTSASVAFSGTFSGSLPTAVSCQILLASNSSIIVDWTNLSSPSVGGGAWSGTLSVPQGGSYFAKCRPNNATSLAATGSNNWFVGIMAVAYGQSNMNGMFGTASSPPAANAQTTYFNGSMWTGPPNANGVRVLLNNINNATGVPIGIVNGSVNGQPIGNLVPGTSLFTNLANSLNSATGGKAETVFFMQGEGDAQGAYINEGPYIVDENLIHSTLAATAGRTLAQMSMYVGGLSTTTSISPNWTRMQRNQLDTNNASLAIYYSHSNIDAVRIDDYHWDAASYGRAGARYAQAFASAVSSWSIASAAVVDATHTDVTVVHSQGTDFTPTTGITGFTISDNNGNTWVTPSAAVRQSATVIRLTHASLGATRVLAYMDGTNPDISGVVLDNSSLQAPLNPSAGNVIVSGPGQLPVPTYNSAGRGSGAVTVTFTGLALGPPSATRLIVGTVVAPVDKTAITGVTITPNSGSPVSATVVHNGSGTGASVFQAVVPTGVYANFSVVYASTIFTPPLLTNWYVDTAILSSTTARSSTSGNSTSSTILGLTLGSTVSGGFIISEVSNGTSSAAIATGTEIYTAQDNSGITAAPSAANASGVATSAANALTWTYGAAVSAGASAASWR